MQTHFIVQTAAAQMPNSCKGIYRRIAVLEVPADVRRASMISKRARDVVRVIDTWERLNVGTTERCAYQVALREAEALRSRLEQRRITQRFGA